MKKSLGTLLKLLATGTISVFLAACYGVMMELKRITVVSPEGTGIEALKVTLHDGTEELLSTNTGPSGSVAFATQMITEGMGVTIEDVDGPANGGEFQTAEIALDERDEYSVSMTRR
jgi:hypothetical protein